MLSADSALASWRLPTMRPTPPLRKAAAVLCVQAKHQNGASSFTAFLMTRFIPVFSIGLVVSNDLAGAA
jgi:hypothetical protein